MKLIWIVGGVTMGLAVIVMGLAWIVGSRLPEAHTARHEIDIDAPVGAVRERIVDVARHPTWRRDVRSIEVVSAEPLRYVEVGSNGSIPYAMLKADDGTVISRIDTDTLAFGGQWTFTLTALGAQRTRVAIVEEGVVRPPLFRTLSRYVFGHTMSMRRYADALAASFSAP
jgi:hypothetical protein